MAKKFTPEIKFKIVETLGKLSENNRGWIKELNLVSWNEQEPKLDIRDWNEDHSKMGRGVTLSNDEARKLVEIIKTKI